MRLLLLFVVLGTLAAIAAPRVKPTASGPSSVTSLVRHGFPSGLGP